PSTAGIPAALLGRHGRRRNGRRHGLFGGQRQNPLLPGYARAGTSVASTRNYAMNEVEFAYRVRQALNEGADRLPYRVVARLEQARRKALARQKAGQERPLWVPALRFAPQGGGLADPDEPTRAWLWAHRLGLAVPLVALTVGFVS